jgi:hypothetical protein
LEIGDFGIVIKPTMSIDLGLNSLLAKTEATMAREKGTKHLDSSSMVAATTDSADMLNNDDSNITFPAVASASASPDRKEKNKNGIGGKRDDDESSMNVSGSLADWNFRGDGSNSKQQHRGESPGDARPQTTSTPSREARRSGTNDTSLNGRGGDGHGGAKAGGDQQMRTSQSAESSAALCAPRTFSPLPLRSSQNRPSTVSALTQPLKSLGNNSLKMSPFGLRSKDYVSEAERIVSNPNELQQWMVKGGVQRAAAELGMDMREIQTRSIKDFAREPGRPNLVSRHIRELRFNHYKLRRIEKIATILNHLAQKKDSTTGKPGHGRASKDVSISFERTITTERRR